MRRCAIVRQHDALPSRRLRYSGPDRTDPHDVPLRLQLSDALKLNPKLATLRVSELFQFPEPLFQRRDCDVDVTRRVPKSIRHGAATHGAPGLRSHDAQED
jgi:hypothetical protein